MSGWLKDGEVLEGEGSGQACQYSPRPRGIRSGIGRKPSPSSTGYKYQTTGLAKHDTMSKAKMLFKLCDKEDKGFITKRDMQRLQGELPLTPEQLESVFENLDRDRNGFLTPLEFHIGLGELVEECEEKDPAEIRFTQILMDLGADKFLKGQWELCSLWCNLQKDKPELLSVLEEILSHVVAHLHDSLRERDSLEQALRRREEDHDRVVRSLYEDLENQLKEEREKRLNLVCRDDSSKQEDKREQLMQELRMREQELEFTLTKQRELESKIEALCRDQASTRGQNQRLQHVNAVLQEQLEESREELHKALSQLQNLQGSLTDQQEGNQRQVQKVSRNMQKERESLTRQLNLLRDMNKRLRDERDTHQDPKRTPKGKRRLEKQGSVIGDYFLVKKPSIRQVSFAGQIQNEPPDVITKTSPLSKCQSGSTTVVTLNEKEAGPQKLFKVVFLGSSGVGKSSFIHYYCKGHCLSNMSTTVGVDFQVKNLLLDSTHIALQLWDTAGQERFHSITQQYYRKADGILVMYDITQISSFMAVRDWLDQVQKNMAEGACLMLLGNKLDMEEGGRRSVTTKQGQKVAEEYQADFFECSAKSGLNIQEAMTHLARLMVTQQNKQRESAFQFIENSNQEQHCCT